MINYHHKLTSHFTTTRYKHDQMRLTQPHIKIRIKVFHRVARMLNHHVKGQIQDTADAIG